MTLSTAGISVATGSGFLGGHLAYRLGVGVDQTTFEQSPADWTPVLADAELPKGKPKRVTVGTTNLILYREEGRTYCIANRCSHRGGPLHKGKIEKGRVSCPWHRSQFSLKDGANPAWTRHRPAARL
jgi:nitrite reductase/ring-hydroxylating ferredoxin subunit